MMIIMIMMIMIMMIMIMIMIDYDDDDDDDDDDLFLCCVSYQDTSKLSASFLSQFRISLHVVSSPCSIIQRFT